MNYKNVQKFITGSREPFFMVANKYINSKSRILDVGAGDGLFAKTIDRADVCMLEGNMDTVEELKKQYPNCTYGKIPILPYEDSHFDLIHSSHVVEHLMPQELYDFLNECDRCLRIGGYLIISAPLMWSEFYDDMSHLKPYNPKLFIKYLSWGKNLCCTKPLISTEYSLIDTIYRYNMLPFDDLEVFVRSELINNILQLYKKVKFLVGFRRLEVSGFTIVLRKQAT